MDVDRRNLILVIGAIVIVIAVAIGAVIAGSKCSVALAGSQVVVDIKGMLAKQKCAEWVEAGFYLTSPQPEKNVVCQRKRDNLTYTVRDRGIFMIVGNAICIDFWQYP